MGWMRSTPLGNQLPGTGAEVGTGTSGSQARTVFLQTALTGSS